MRRVIIGLLALALGGCITLSGAMRRRIGQRDTDLVLAWGAPDRQVTLADSSRVLTWVSGSCEQSYAVSRSGVVTGFSYAHCPRIVYR